MCSAGGSRVEEVAARGSSHFASGVLNREPLDSSLDSVASTHGFTQVARSKESSRSGQKDCGLRLCSQTPMLPRQKTQPLGAGGSNF